MTDTLTLEEVRATGKIKFEPPELEQELSPDTRALVFGEAWLQSQTPRGLKARHVVVYRNEKAFGTIVFRMDGVAR